MKKFSLTLAKKGRKLTTKKGDPAILLYSERENTNFPLIVLIKNKKAEYYTEKGKYYLDRDSDMDLYLK